MKERPILFSAPMVRALLDGTKTQTRRVAKLTDAAHVKEVGGHRRWHPADENCVAASPYGQPGDRLWVREAWTTHACFDHIRAAELTTISLHYQADGRIQTGRNRAAMHMPRWASRILLEVTAVRVERLQAISDADAKAEGLRRYRENGIAPDLYSNGMTDGFIFPVDAYSALWEAINGPDSWALNPWVWVIEFKRVQP